MVHLRLGLSFLQIFFIFVVTSVLRIVVKYPHPLVIKAKKWSYRQTLRFMGCRTAVQGSISTETPTLYVSNHVSYKDILVLGSILDAGFVAKAEVASWPIVGKTAELHGTLFVKRQRSSVKGELSILQKELSNGRSLIIFAEGTSFDGTHIKPLKSTFLCLPPGVSVNIQPVNISYTHCHGLPLGRFGRWIYGWFGDTELVPHLKRVIAKGPFTATVIFSPSFLAKDEPRKELTQKCQKILDSTMPIAHGSSLSS